MIASETIIRITEDWLRYYNEEGPHDTIGNKPPINFQNSIDTVSPST